MSGGGSGPNTSKLLLILMGVVPLVVVLAVAVAFLLVWAGVGPVVGAGVPFVVATILVVGLGVALGRRAASGSGNPPDDSSDGSCGRSRRRDSGRDGV
jgi:hypothetical protein